MTSPSNQIKVKHDPFRLLNEKYDEDNETFFYSQRLGSKYSQLKPLLSRCLLFFLNINHLLQFTLENGSQFILILCSTDQQQVTDWLLLLQNYDLPLANKEAAAHLDE